MNSDQTKVEFGSGGGLSTKHFLLEPTIGQANFGNTLADIKPGSG